MYLCHMRVAKTIIKNLAEDSMVCDNFSLSFISNLRTGIVSMFSLYEKEKSILIISYIRFVTNRI